MKQKLKNINRIILHVLETKRSMDVGVDTVRLWHKNRGFDDVGYHFIIRFNGDIEIGRPMDVVGAHTKGHNIHSLGIALEGGYGGVDMRTSQQKESLENLLKSLSCIVGSEVAVFGHNTYSSKACPNFDAVSEYNPMAEVGKESLYLTINGKRIRRGTISITA